MSVQGGGFLTDNAGDDADRCGEAGLHHEYPSHWLAGSEPEVRGEILRQHCRNFFLPEFMKNKLGLP